MSEKLRTTYSELESSNSSSPKPLENETCHYKTALFTAGSHWAAASSIASSGSGNAGHRKDENADDTILAQSDSPNREKERFEEGTTMIKAEVISVTVVKVNRNKYSFIKLLKPDLFEATYYYLHFH